KHAEEKCCSDTLNFVSDGHCLHILPSQGHSFGHRAFPVYYGMIFHVHDLWARLMTEKLGYERFGAHGGDWGSTVTEQLARSHADTVVAIHLTDVPFGHLFQKPDDPSPSEKKFFKHNEDWMQKES